MPGDVSIRTHPEGLLVGFRVSPSARRTRFQGLYGDRLKVQVSAPPEDNRANEELVEAVAGWLEVAPGFVSIFAGHKSRDKVLAFRGIEEETLRERLGRLARGGR